MSFTFTCDYCGQEIKDHHDSVTLSSDAKGKGSKKRSGWIGHYHDTSASPCFDEIWEIVKLTKEYGETIESIPVATGQKIAAERRKHKRPGATAAAPEDAERTPLWTVVEGIPNAARRHLTMQGVVSLDDAARWSRDELLALSFVGPHTIECIEAALKARGLAFAGVTH